MFLDRGAVVRTAAIFGLLSAAILVGHGLFYGLSDLRPVNDKAQTVWGWLVVYHLVANIPLWIAVLFTKRQPVIQAARESRFDYVSNSLQRQFMCLLVLGLIGLILHWDAKLRLIDGSFDGCWAGLRSAWLNQAERASGWERIESILGHLLSSAAYLGVLLSANALVSKGCTLRNLIYFCVFAAMGFMYALAIVSRSIMLVQLGMVLVACLLGLTTGGISFHRWASRSFLVIGLFAGLSFIIAMNLFANTVRCTERHLAHAAEMDKTAPARIAPGVKGAVIYYENGFLNELPVKREAAPNLSQRAVRQYCNFCNTVFIYLNHGIYNFTVVLDTEERGNYVLLRFAENWARRLHILAPETGPAAKRVYGGGGVTLPGAALHDFGSVGVIATALAHGLFILLSIWLLRGRGLVALVGLALFVACGLTMAISGLFVAPALIGFPFVMFAIMVWGGILLLYDRYRHERTPNLAQAVPLER